MGVDPTSDDVVRRKPRRRTERVIKCDMCPGVIGFGLANFVLWADEVKKLIERRVLRNHA